MQEEFDIEAYATVCVALAEGRPRDVVLREHDLDEGSWAALDQYWQDRLSRAMNEDTEGVPPLVAAYSAAFERARAKVRAGQPILSIERFADATREIQLRGDPTSALQRVGVTLMDFLRANEHWTARMMKEPEMLEIFRKRLQRR